MRSAPRGFLLLASLALPIAAVLISFALTGGARAPQVPDTVRVGSSPGPGPSPNAPVPAVPGPSDVPPPPAELPPPAPHDDDVTDGHDD
ncbi:hypothetical protein EIL87_22750 [Saccharopolyspora rhizosphaerae]|uniref:Small hydrophilic protein n=1 Tax=Saccharopolyspora rhizosphaerae TaxID=2492662 RepID=A0A3R8QYF9_9PSEU|nr:hypothetical protein [Saccharopolyspora rhizosphaerae]RRO13799.1 hypothetical protein EIL87_22750 [Saccharopolyspora rhizosphaerae]